MRTDRGGSAMRRLQGYHLGQFRIPIEKMLPYETDIRIPLFIKGPGIPAGTTLTQPVMNIDVAPTLLELAGLPVPPIMDGQSMVPLLMAAPTAVSRVRQPGWRTRFASEFAEGGFQNYGPFRGAPGLYDNPDNQWRMLRVLNDTHDIAYMEWDSEYLFNKIDFREYYNLSADPWQRENLWNSTSPDTQGALHAELVNLFTCSGSRTQVSDCHARSASPLIPPAPAPPPTPPSPAPSPPGKRGCAGEPTGVVLNDTDILGADIVSPCQQVEFPGTYQGALSCQQMCATDTACTGWTFHLKAHEKKWRCCVKSAAPSCVTHANMWSGLQERNVNGAD